MARSIPVFAALAALALGAPARAGGPPPSIDDLDGASFVLRAQVTEHSLSGEESKYTVEISTTLTKTSATTVSMSGVFGGMSFTSHYVDGFLMQAVDFEPGSPPTSATWMFAEVSGSPGKLKLRGVLNVYDVPPAFQVLRLNKVSGKQITP